MIAVALLASVAVAAPAAPAPFPAEAVYGAFATACADIASLDAAATRIAGQGWTRVEPAPDSEIGRLLAMGREAARGLGVTETGAFAFRRTVDGVALDLLLSGVAVDGDLVNGCRLYAFGDVRGVPDTVISAALGRAPMRAGDDVLGARRSEWQPGLNDGQLSVEAMTVPAGSRVASMLGFHGTALVAQGEGRTVTP